MGHDGWGVLSSLFRLSFCALNSVVLGITVSHYKGGRQPHTSSLGASVAITGITSLDAPPTAATFRDFLKIISKNPCDFFQRLFALTHQDSLPPRRLWQIALET